MLLALEIFFTAFKLYNENINILPVLPVQQGIEECGFSGIEKSGQGINWYLHLLFPAKQSTQLLPV